ncbi:arginine/serine-rich protein 1 isoform X2 [Lates japonicus]|uniref:Arginine/serine-rich protein 1 isoform X2 n=1 Tax=Lates japonicus TaxID=270547 RepID=A0AAD3NDA7_LATJO|nr:arginine/serine-rich protein 1 isoform X2 [Lates japonicus]
MLLQEPTAQPPHQRQAHIRVPRFSLPVLQLLGRRTKPWQCSLIPAEAEPRLRIFRMPGLSNSVAKPTSAAPSSAKMLKSYVGRSEEFLSGATLTELLMRRSENIHLH